MVVYVSLIVAWGAHNAWPPEIWSSLVFCALGLLLSWHLYRTNSFGLETVLETSEWELLIAFLLLAIGVASGLLLLMVLGWTSLGVAWMRPTRQGVDWREWAKIPLLFLNSLPVWLDLAGSRHDWFQYFESTRNSADLPEAMALLRLHVLGPLSVFILAYWLKGRTFWLSLPLVPVLLLVRQHLANHLPDPWRYSALLSESFSWLFLPTVLFAYVFVAKRWNTPARTPPRHSDFFGKWILRQSHIPWLTTLVFLLQQSSLVEGWLAKEPLRFDVPGAVVLIGLLAWWRWRGPVTGLDDRSRIMTVAALGSLLAAEWMDLNPVRHFSLGVLVVALFSWHRVWSWTVMTAGTAFWVTLLPGFEFLLIRLTNDPVLAAHLRLGTCLVGLVALGLALLRMRNMPPPRQHDNSAWQPAKRLAFISFFMVLIFQNVSAFWPESLGGYSDVGFEPPADGSFMRLRSPVELEGMSEVLHWRTVRLPERVEVIIARPSRRAYELKAPESMFRSWEWRIVGRRLIPSEHGQAAELQLERHGHDGSAIYWFDHAGNRFTNYLRGRRVLWSGWNLAKRDLRLIVLISGTARDPAGLVAFAESQNWFRMKPGVGRKDGRRASAGPCLFSPSERVSLQHRALPTHQIACVPLPVLGQQLQGHPTGDQRGIDTQFPGSEIAFAPHGFQAMPLRLGYLLPHMAHGMGPPSWWQSQTAAHRSQQPSLALGREARGNQISNRSALGGGHRDCDKPFMRQYEIGGAIGRHGFALPPMPQLAQDPEPQTVQAAGAFDAPDQIRIGRLDLRTGGHQTSAGFAEPLQASFPLQLGFQEIRQRLEVKRVVARIGLHADRQRPARPIGFLGAFLQRHSQMPGDQRGQAQLLQTQQSGSLHRVEDC